MSDKDVRDAGNQAEEKIQKWGVELVFRPDLYRAVKEFSESPEAAALEGEQARFLQFWLRDLRRAGHELDEATRAEVKRLTERMVEVGIAFQRNIDEHKDHLVVTKEDLEGMPDSYIENLERGDNDDTYHIGLSYPDVVPFMENSPRRDLREQLLSQIQQSRRWNPTARCWKRRSGPGRGSPDCSARPHGRTIRWKRRWPRRPEAVRGFYAALVPGLTEGGQSELKVMEALLKSDGHETPLQVFDRSYYETQLRKTEYGVDPMEVAGLLPPPAGPRRNARPHRRSLRCRIPKGRDAGRGIRTCSPMRSTIVSQAS